MGWLRRWRRGWAYRERCTHLCAFARSLPRHGEYRLTIVLLVSMSAGYVLVFWVCKVLRLRASGRAQTRHDYALLNLLSQIIRDPGIGIWPSLIRALRWSYTPGRRTSWVCLLVSRMTSCCHVKDRIEDVTPVAIREGCLDPVHFFSGRRTFFPKDPKVGTKVGKSAPSDV